MSKLCDQVIGVVKQVFPELLIRTEECVYYNKQRLFLDIYLPQLNLAIEVHGRQHDEFVAHFHGDAKGYKQSRQRDRIKEEWADMNGCLLVILRESDLPITPEGLLDKINDAGNS